MTSSALRRTDPYRSEPRAADRQNPGSAHLRRRIDWLLIAIVIVGAACQPTGQMGEVSSATPGMSVTAADTPGPAATAPLTPPALPGIFQTDRLNPLDTPRAYIEDTCRYLRDKWSSNNAAPGTVVMIIKLHSINQGAAEGSDDISVADFQRMMDDLHRQQFQAITARQLADFLESNTTIPVRSVALVQDGRHTAENFNDRFRRYWDKWGWPVINALDTQANTSDAFWTDQAELEQEGWVDHQAYGPSTGPSGSKPDEEHLAQGMQQSLALFRQHFDKAPIAIVWPAGLDQGVVHTARDLGYRLGFTLNARGPVMYNWVPLAEAGDPRRPSYVPEGPVGDPLMTLPRYWPSQVRDAIDSVRLLGQDAAAFAEQNRATELQYYDIVCAPEQGPIP